MSSIKRMNKEYFLMLGRGSCKTLMMKRYLEEMRNMNKFEIGDKVKLTKLDMKYSLHVPGMNKYLGQIGTVKSNEGLDAVTVDFNDGLLSFIYPDEWLELIEKNKPYYWNGKFIVVGECSTKSWIYPKMQPVTIGKVYELKDGKVTLDDGRVIQNYNYTAFNAFASRLRDFGVRIIEFMGFCQNEGKGKNE